MQTIKWEYCSLVAHNPVTHAWISELAQVQKSPSTIENYSRDLEDFLQAVADLPFPAVLEADETLIARYVDGLWSRPARRGSGHQSRDEHIRHHPAFCVRSVAQRGLFNEMLQK